MQSRSTAAAQTHPCGAAGSRTRQRQRGSGRLKAIVWLAILVAMVYVGIKVVPVLFSEYEFQDALQTTARFASVNRTSEGEIKDALIKEAEKEDIPVRPEDIEVHGQNGNVQIDASYSVTVDLGVYQWTLNFHPSVRNNALL
jgi:hypothetical protein